VQDLPYATLKPRLEAQGQVLTLPKEFKTAAGTVPGKSSGDKTPPVPAGKPPKGD
jgi:hypothetical protein